MWWLWSCLHWGNRENNEAKSIEYKRAVRKAEPRNAIAVHTATTLHSMGKIWDYRPGVKPGKKSQGALHIMETCNALNSDTGLLLNPVWITPCTKVMTPLIPGSTSSFQDQQSVKLWNCHVYIIMTLSCILGHLSYLSPFTLSCPVISILI